MKQSDYSIRRFHVVTRSPDRVTYSTEGLPDAVAVPLVRTAETPTAQAVSPLTPGPSPAAGRGESSIFKSCRILVAIGISFAAWSGALFAAEPAAEEHPLSIERRTALNQEFERTVRETSQRIEANPKDKDAFSRRGDAQFFRGRFDDALADYDKMIELQPDLRAEHWRRGIALFYAGRHEQAAKQFEAYHTFDDVDRENGIWRYFSQRKAFGLQKAREGLLKYKKDDREPFPDVYKLFAGELKPDEILKRIAAVNLNRDERDKRLFYAELYIGLNDVVEGRNDSAKLHLREAVKNPWGPRGGYGPAYMWHVGRVQYELLIAPKKP